jgi:hypothetical protein
VWAAAADGSSPVQLTQDGSPQTPYETPSQADDGTVLAVRGSRLVRLDRSGRQVATLGSVLTDKPGTINAFGPWDAKLSLDGSTIAVYEQPSWTQDSQHLLLFDELNGGVPQVVRAGVAANHNDAQGWFHDLDTFTPGPEGWHPIGAGELSRDGSRLTLRRAATNAGNGGSARGKGNRVTLYTVSGFDRAPQAMYCGFTDEHGGELGPPTWSPDGRQLAWAAAEGIWVGTIGDPASCSGWSVKLVVPGGHEPTGARPRPDPARRAAARRRPAPRHPAQSPSARRRRSAARPCCAGV